MDKDGRPRVLFLGVRYVGHQTRFENLKTHAGSDPRIAARFAAIDGWREGGRLESIPGLPGGVAGRLRATMEARAYAAFPRPDVIWTSANREIAPYTWSQLGRFRRPVIFDLDATDGQLEAMAGGYWDRRPRAGLRRSLMTAQERAVRHGVTLFAPWSRWAAEGLEAEGVPAGRIRVLPPGVDLDRWRPSPRADAERPIRLLFVGGDFVRKGGNLLLDAVARFDGQFVTTVVTRDDVDALPPGVRIERAAPNDGHLLDLYAQADVFVLPTRAECFGIAAVEAMASGLPVVMTDIGGARDIVAPGATGWLIEPRIESLIGALEDVLRNRASLRAIGARAREQAEERFDGRRNDATLVDWALELDAARRRR